MTAAVLAVDGGNSKTDVALIGIDGTLLGLSRGPGSCHQNIGVEATMQVLSELVAVAAAEAGWTRPVRWRGTARSTWPGPTCRSRSRCSRSG
jgi:N-acetylglucosamine kinase-like BadF-type ATPase